MQMLRRDGEHMVRAFSVSTTEVRQNKLYVSAHVWANGSLDQWAKRYLAVIRYLHWWPKV